MQLPRGNPNKAWIKLAGAAGRRGQGALEHGIFDILSPCGGFFFVLGLVFFFGDAFIFLWKEEKPHLFPKWRKKHTPESLAKPHFPHV